VAKRQFKPSHSVGFSVKVGEKKYIKGPMSGLFGNDGKGPILKGTFKGEYLTKLKEFITKAEAKDLAVSVAIFKQTAKKEDNGDDWGDSHGGDDKGEDFEL
jgi:hypothetical protein